MAATKRIRPKAKRVSAPKAPASGSRAAGAGRGKASAPVLVVGLGASAGGVEAFQAFLRVMPSDAGIAYVLIPHLDPKRKTALPAILGRATAMPVKLAARCQRLVRDHVYVAPPGMRLTLHGDTLTPERTRGLRAPIDDFFTSLAEARGPAAACIVLSGTGADGTLGLRAIKEAGGLTLAQASDAALHSGMPRSAAATGLVDLVLPVEAMPETLLAYAARTVALSDGRTEAALQAELCQHLAAICALLRSRAGHDFSQYKESTLLRRIQRRMSVLHLDKVASYVAHLRRDAGEADHLFEDLLIGVTRFFRDKAAFAALESKVVPRLLEKPVDDCVRIWVAGCSTGEEAYSIAILLRERMRAVNAACKVQIFATDIDEKALDYARTGLYPEMIARDVSAKRLKQFFLPRGKAFQVAKDIREMVVFSAHDLIRNPPFSRLDLIACRNVLIYMKPELQNEVLPLFHFALRPGRYLFLGPAESVTQRAKLFAPVDARNRIFRTVSAAARELPVLPFAAREKPLALAVERALVAGFLPPHAVVNPQHELVYASAGVARYLEVPPGAPTTNVLSMARPGLRLDLRSALAAAGQRRRRVVHDCVLTENGAARAVRLVAEPLDLADGGDLVLLVFDDRGVAPAPDAKAMRRREASENKLVKQLEAELRATQERLQTTIEELETSNEELKSSNEEFQSMNEELQSANEELETSREELQSINEELETVNSELTAKIEMLDRANSDLKNLLESTQIATLFLDREQRIKNFTPMAKDLFHLIESDIGRPIGHVVSRLAYGGIAEDAARVLRTLQPVEKELQTSDGPPRSYIMRMLPYRTVENVIDGVVITFVDITERKALEEERARLGNIVAFSADAIVGLNLEGEILAWNAGAERILGYTAKEALGQRWTLLFAPAQRAAEEARIKSAMRDQVVAQEDTVMLARGGRTVPVSITISAAKDLSGRPFGASLIARDITERRQAEMRQGLLRDELNHRVKNTLATVLAIANQTLGEAQSLEDFGRAFSGRVRALAGTQALLTRSNWEGAALRDIVAEECRPHAEPGGPAYILSGPDVQLAPKAALALGLAFHELATNAAKYGAWSQPGGRVSVEWSVEAKKNGETLRLHWAESGGPPVAPPQRRGFGRQLVEDGVAYELDGAVELRFESGGLICEMSIPAREALAHESLNLSAD